MIYAVIAIIAALTCAFMPNFPGIRYNREVMLGVVCIGACAVALTRWTWAGAAVLACIAVRLFVSDSWGISRSVPMFGFFSILLIAGLSSSRQWMGRAALVYDAVCLIVLANVGFQILQAFGVWFRPVRSPIATLGLLANPDEISAFLGICLPFFFRCKWWWGIGAVILGLVLAQAMQGVVIAGTVAFVWLWINARTKTFVLAALAVIVGLYVFAVKIDRFDLNAHLASRGLTWWKTAKVAMVKPLAGWGFGQYSAVIPLLTASGTMGAAGRREALNRVSDKRALVMATIAVTGTTSLQAAQAYLYDPKNNRPEVMLEAHNDYVELLFSGGLILLALVFIAIYRTLLTARKRVRIIPGLSFLGSCIGATMFFVWQIVPIMVITVLSVVLIYGDKPESPSLSSSPTPDPATAGLSGK